MTKHKKVPVEDEVTRCYLSNTSYSIDSHTQIALSLKPNFIIVVDNNISYLLHLKPLRRFDR